MSLITTIQIKEVGLGRHLLSSVCVDGGDSEEKFHNKAFKLSSWEKFHNKAWGGQGRGGPLVAEGRRRGRGRLSRGG